MNVFYAMLVMILSLNAFSRDDFDKRIKTLSRIQSITFLNEKYEFGFISGYESAHFLTPYERHQLTISPTDSGYDLQIFISENVLINLSVPKGQIQGTFAAKKFSAKGKDSFQSQGLNKIFYNYSTLDSGSPITVQINVPMFSTANITESITRSGPMDFSPCDGCEHGDQMIIEDVNVVNIGFGEYYVGDCDGQFQRLLSQLLVYNQTEDKDGLGVPFTYRGRINFDSGDYVEEINNLWNVDAKRGSLSIDWSTQSPQRFIDSQIHKVAAKLGKEAFEVWEDVLEHGEFTQYEHPILTFKYAGVTIKTDLKTGRTIEE